MLQKPVYLIGVGYGAFRPGKPGIITGMKTCTPDGKGYTPRICYEVVYPDGVLDLVTLVDVEAGNYVFSMEKEHGKTNGKD